MLIPNSKNVKTITDMREDALGLLDLVKKQGVTYIFHRSKPKAVMIDVDEFIRIQELLEDYIDEMDARQLEKEPRGKGILLETVMKEYVQDPSHKKS